MVKNGHKFEAAVVPEDFIHTVLYTVTISLATMDIKEHMLQ